MIRILRPSLEILWFVGEYARPRDLFDLKSVNYFFVFSQFDQRQETEAQVYEIEKPRIHQTILGDRRGRGRVVRKDSAAH